MDFQYCLKTYSFLCKTKQSHQSYHNARDWNSTTQKILKAMIQVIKFWIAKRNPNFHREGKIFASFLFLEKQTEPEVIETYRISMTPGCCDGTQIRMETSKENGGENLGEGPWKSYHARRYATDSRVSVPHCICCLHRGVFGNWFWFIHEPLFRLFFLCSTLIWSWRGHNFIKIYSATSIMMS